MKSRDMFKMSLIFQSIVELNAQLLDILVWCGLEELTADVAINYGITRLRPCICVMDADTVVCDSIASCLIWTYLMKRCASLSLRKN